LLSWVDSVIEILFIGSAVVSVILVFVIARYMSTGIFRRFFLFLKLTLIVVLLNRIHTDLVAGNVISTVFLNPLSADYAFRIVWSTLLMLSLAFLYVDWRRTSLDQPIKPRSAAKVAGHGVTV
jgi:hypothetical protein